ncbi:hypothetical protein CRM22_005748 [Opisthorchis felineus]|uniref:Frizzled-8 n=1 Tax=Opisthorchis felineus TaxID=147828 RepID=A0A4S2LX06_OPIFE|nr:hypothetical protein CRM22_005748 [Opisthorchis felineus]
MGVFKARQLHKIQHHTQPRLQHLCVIFLYISAVLLRTIAAHDAQTVKGRTTTGARGAAKMDRSNKQEHVNSLFNAAEDPEWHLAPFHEIVGSHLTDSSSHRCEPISLALCKGMEYQHTRMPNMFNHETQEEAGLEAHQFYPLVQINCSEDLRFFLCSIYTPICIEGYPSFLPPCRSICERVKAGCAPVMQHYNFPWPTRMNCAQFPEYNNPDGILCMERNLTGSEAHSTERTGNVEPPMTVREKARMEKPEIIIQLTNPVEVTASPLTQVDWLNAEASQLLLSFARHNKTMKQILDQRPGLRLKCSCRCKPAVYRQYASIAEDDITTLDECEMPCHPPHISPSLTSSWQLTVFWLAFWSILCLASTMTTIFTFLFDSSRFQYPELPVVYLSVCYFMVSIGYIIRVMLGHESVACEIMSHSPSYQQMEVLQTISGVDSSKWTDSLGELMASSTLSPITSMPFSRLKVLRHASTGRVTCAAVFLFTYFFSIASAVWWVVLTLTWLLAAGMKWGSEAISKYSQVFHFIAWSIPTALSSLALLLSAVEGDILSGLCVIRTSKPLQYVLFLFAPMVILLATGILFLVIGFIALFRIRGIMKLQRIGSQKTDRLEHLMTRIGTFALLYTAPNLVVIICMGYELQNARAWEFGVACDCHYMDALATSSSNEPLPEWSRPSPDYQIFMVKHFMHLIIGVTSGFWIWSRKTVDTWRRACRRTCSKKQRRQNGTMRLLPTSNPNESDGSTKTQFVPWTFSGLNTDGDSSKKLVQKQINREPPFIGNAELAGTTSGQSLTAVTQCRDTPTQPISSVHYDTNSLHLTPYVTSRMEMNGGYALVDESRERILPSRSATQGMKVFNGDPFLIALPPVPPRSALHPSTSHTSGFQTSPSKSTQLSPTNLSAFSSSGIGSGHATNLAFDMHSQSHGTSLLTDLSEPATKSGSELSNTFNAEPVRRNETMPHDWHLDLTSAHNPFQNPTRTCHNFAKARCGQSEENISQCSLAGTGYYQPVGSVLNKTNRSNQSDVERARPNPDGQQNSTITRSSMNIGDQGRSYNQLKAAGRLCFQKI